MENNDILRRLRYALNISNKSMGEIFKLSNHEITDSDILDILKKEDQAGYVECSSNLLVKFLDGLIISRRGESNKKPEDKPVESEKENFYLSNNVVFKKLRIALELREENLLEILKLADIVVSKNELTALFRKEGHKHYKKCGDQFLRNFLVGLTVYYKR